MRTSEGAFSLMELVTVLVIIGILAAIGGPMFIKSIEEAKNREAVAALRLIRTAERLYYLDSENGEYISASNTSEVNEYLDLDIESKDWRFWVNVDTTSSPPTFTAYAERTLTARKRVMSIGPDSPNVTCDDSGGCCCYSWGN